MYTVRTPALLRMLYRDALWSCPSERDRTIYLTFDDGPEETVTPYLLDLLRTHHVLASFFCIGSQVEKHRDIFERIKAEGHVIGNHSYSHQNGLLMKKGAYAADVALCHEVFKSPYFRPPYGMLSRGQYLRLKKKYTIVMWDVLSGDFDVNVHAEQCHQNIISKVRNGSIILMHDNAIAGPKTLEHLESTIIHLKRQGYQLKGLPQ